jgi:predicted membrane protein
MDADRWERKRERWERRWEERMARRRDRWNNPSRHLFSGFVFLAIGIVFLLGNMGFLNVDAVLRFWPVILIALGVFRLVEHHDDFRSGSGIFWIVIGGLFLMGNLHVLRIAMRDIWPVILIGLGCLMLWRSTWLRRELDSDRGAAGGEGRTDEPSPDEARQYEARPNEARGEEPSTSSNSVLSASAILGGSKRRNNSQDFRGGDVTAIMGGCELDLRTAGITPPHEAVLEVFAMWGGIILKVPTDWTVISSVDPILGGFDDKTLTPREDSKRLVVRGTVLMGGIEVRN